MIKYCFLGGNLHMRLSELAENSNLVLEININDQHLEFKSVVVKTSKYVLIEPIRVNGKVVNFEIGQVLIDMILIRNDKAPIVWKRVLLKNTILNKKTYYKVIPTGDGFEVNRRSAFRMFIGIDGVVQVGFNSKAMDVIVKDISENGFSFVCKENISKPLQSTIRMVFSDINKTFNLIGIVVREEEINESKYIYGCILNVKNQLLNHYISQKQREMLFRQRQIAAQSREAVLRDVQAFEKRQLVIDEKLKSENMQSSIGKKKPIDDVLKRERRKIFSKE